MAEHSTIEWTDATWNPITGCSIVSPGCTNCYAMGLAGTRLQHHPSRAGLTRPSKAGPVWNGVVRLNEEWLMQPLQWRRPRMIFVCAHGDLFHESVPDAWIDRVFAVMALCPQHTFQVLTKRSARMRAYLADLSPASTRVSAIRTATAPFVSMALDSARPYGFPLPNVWLGVSAEDQRRADERVPDLLATPAAVRFVSAEPLLGPIDFTRIEARSTGTLIDGDFAHPKRIDALTGWAGHYQSPTAFHPQSHRLARLDWIIVGGESGPKARAMHPTWVREIRDPCAAAGTAFYFKQWGAWQPRAWCRDGGTHAMRVWAGQESFQQIQSHPNSIERVGAGSEWCAFALVGKKAAGRVLDGVVYDEMPEVRI